MLLLIVRAAGGLGWVVRGLRVANLAHIVGLLDVLGRVLPDEQLLLLNDVLFVRLENGVDLAVVGGLFG